MHETILVADGSPLIVLTKIGRITVLRQLAARVVVPSHVWREVIMNKPASFDSRELASADWIEVQSMPPGEAAKFADDLDLGEAEAIALALRLPGCRLLMDERLGRREARRLGLLVIGTLGLLREAKSRGLISALGGEIEKLQAIGQYMSPTLIAEALRSAGEA
jgi:hypothetical protein